MTSVIIRLGRCRPPPTLIGGSSADDIDLGSLLVCRFVSCACVSCAFHLDVMMLWKELLGVRNEARETLVRTCVVLILPPLVLFTCLCVCVVSVNSSRMMECIV
uniref:Uncharacterized protein n=1 Tax=Vitrella brassicaformis TaxID=1169539 RepID=A0A7S1P210_9ALVE